MTPAMTTFYATFSLSCECGCDDNTSQIYKVEAADHHAAHDLVKARLAGLKNEAKALWPEADEPVLDDWFVWSPETIETFDPQDEDEEEGEDLAA